MRPFSSKTISTGSYTIGSFAKGSTLKSGLIWMLFRDSSGERGGWSAYFLPQPTRKIKATTQYSFRFIIGTIRRLHGLDRSNPFVGGRIESGEHSEMRDA